MSKYAENFIDSKLNELNKNKSSDFVKISSRIEYQDFIMLELLSKTLKFPISTAFTDIIEHNLVDIVLCLSKDEQNEIGLHFESTVGGGALDELRSMDIIKSFAFY
jgi:sulfite reductase beta subunit-like hemoprotein